MTETNVALLKQEIHYMTDKIDKIDKRLESFENKLDIFIENADKRYASKSLETGAKRAGGVIGGLLIVALMKTILLG